MKMAELTVRIKAIGTEEVTAAIERCAPAMRRHCERLVKMGWTPPMAEKFVGDIAVTVVSEMITTKTVGAP